MKKDKLFTVKRRLFYEGFTQNNYTFVKELLEAHPELLNVSIEAIDPEDYDYDEDDGKTPLLSAIAFSDYEMFRMLIEDFKVDVNIGDYAGITALWELSRIDRKDRMYWVDLLLKYGVDIHTHTYTGMTPLMLAAKEGYIEMVEKLIDLGINVSFQDNDGDNVFHWIGMAYDGERDEKLIDKIVQILLKSGIDIYVKDKQGYSALDLAQKYNRPVVEKVLKKYIKKEQNIDSYQPFI